MSKFRLLFLLAGAAAAGRAGPASYLDGGYHGGALVVTDPALLDRILRNLLDNAVKYTRSGGVLLGCRHRGRWISIQVWDTGIGIPAERIHEVFEEFQQLRVLAHDGGKGMGLGLPVAERLARAIGHPLGVRSAVGHGSVFEVVVPLAGG